MPMFSSGYPPLRPPSFYCFSGCQHWNCLRYQLFLLGGELGDDPPSPCRCWAGAEPRAARVLSRVHSLDIGNWAGKLGRQGRKHHVEMGITSKDVFIP